MKNKERIAILETEISRLKVANRNASERLEAIEGKLGIEVPRPARSAVVDAMLNRLIAKVEQRKSESNHSEIPNSCDPFSAFPDPLQDLCNFVATVEMRKVKPEAPECVANNGVGEKRAGMRIHTSNLDSPITPDFIPDWKDAPEDAVCVAMDGDGTWWWYDCVPPKSISVFEGGIARAGFATNAYLLPPDYWKGTLMMRPEAVKDYSHLLPEGYEFCQEGEHDEFVKVEMFGIDREQPLGFITDYNTFIGKYLPIRKSAPDYSHLLPEGYEFCSEADAEKWVKVELKSIYDDSEFTIGTIRGVNIYRGTWLPIRPIQYKVTTHEIVNAVPDPYMPDWSQAPEGTVAHAWDKNGNGHWYHASVNGNVWFYCHRKSDLTLPPDLDWKKSLRVKPN